MPAVVGTVVPARKKERRKTKNINKTIFSFQLINFGCEGKDSQKRELNHCNNQEPNGEKTRNQISVSDVGGKTSGPNFMELLITTICLA